ncbi:MAG TPA: hypothetical protein VH743_10145, partial [Beijerinckiaceae bacterium]|jgi:hypothetical protein
MIPAGNQQGATLMDSGFEAQIAMLRLILSNVVARMAGADDDGGRGMLQEMADQCKIAAEQMIVGPERTSLVRDTHTHLDEFFKGITIT